MSVSTSRHHADWLSLVEVSGPFISLPVLLKVFPQGLESRDPAQAKALRAAYDEWQDNPTAPGRQRAWVLHVLTSLLGYPANLIAEGQAVPAGLEANMAEMSETLRPDFALVSPSGTEAAGQAQLLIASYAAEQALDHPVIGRHWKANAVTRMTELLHAAGVALGLVTNGEQWMLVFAPRGETTGYASWYSALWLDEPITLRAFHSLLGARRFFGVAAESTLLGLLKESAQDQQEVTDQLGYQVRQAVQVLVQAFDTLDQDSNRTLLKGVSESVLYEAALTVMMRLVFLFSAEERGLLHLGKPLYDDNYAVSTLLEQLQEVADLHGPQVLERRFDAWARLLATFRAVHGGVHHQDLLMPAYGGSLFDPDRYPFLEGRGMGTNWAATQAQPLAVNNRVALHLLTSLQRLRIKVPGGGPLEARRVSFRALGVEQIGHVYEGLLDHTAVRATETVLGIKGTRDKETEIALTTLEAKLTQGQDTLSDFLKDETGRSASAIRNAMEEESSDDEHKLLIACGHEKELLQRVRPFAGLIREDSFERPLIVLPGSIYVTRGTTRRSTGTHYTPPSLTGPIVQYTLEPLVYQGPAEGLPREQWQLKSPKEILGLKVCDMAMGSGAFLVQACRYLAERLTEAWENEEKKHPDEFLVTPEGGFSQGLPSERLVPQESAERLAIARRIVADRCVYGVDINPMAVEMAKLSVWLITLDAKRPFTFLDHAFKCGDSLLGVTSFKQLEDFSFRPEGSKQFAFSTMNLWRHIDEAKAKREALEAMPSDTPEQIVGKSALLAEAEEAVAKLKAAGDILVALELRALKARAYETEREALADMMMYHWQKGIEDLREYAGELLHEHRTLHWPLAFPEIIQRGGFDAFVGNPPFVGGSKIGTLIGSDYRDYLVNHVASGRRGLADYVAYFFLRSMRELKEGGTAGLIATKSLAQGDTREVGLDQMVASGATIYRAIPSRKWPGQANLHVAQVWLRRGTWNGPYALEDKLVSGITSQLTDSDLFLGDPYPLVENAAKSFEGSKLSGMGFLLSAAEASRLIESDQRYQDVVVPYLGGKDLTDRWEQSPSRWVINFRDWPIDKARQYPGCFEIVERLVKPEREKNNRKVYRDRWWHYAEKRPELYATVDGLDRVLVAVRVSAHHSIGFAPTGIVYSDRLAVLALDRGAHFALLCSTIHDSWAHRPGATTHETRNTYFPERSFETFPFPRTIDSLDALGERYHLRRQEVMRDRREGLTTLYNRFHSTEEDSEDITALRLLHAELDSAVCQAYGLKNLDLDHSFYETKQGSRFTISDSSSRVILTHLMSLNHERHAEEEGKAMTVMAKSQPTTRRGRKVRTEAASSRIDSFDFEGAEHE